MISTERLEQRINELGMNPYSTAKKAGLGPDYVRDLLRGKVKQPSASRLRELAKALDCSPEYLMGIGGDLGEKPFSWGDDWKPEPVKLSVEYVIKDGYFEGNRAFKPKADLAYWVVSAFPSGNEWLERVDSAQKEGDIPANVFLHVLAPEHHYKGLTNLFVVEIERDDGKLLGRKVRRAPHAGAGDFRLLGHYADQPISWEEAVRGHEKNGKIVGAVLRYYRFFDDGTPIDALAF